MEQATHMLQVDQEGAVYRIFDETFDPAPFRGSNEQARLRGVVHAIHSRDFQIQLDFVLGFCDVLCHIQDWGTGCSCHEEELRRGEDTES